MKHRTADLEGAALDAAVAMAEGKAPEIVPYRVRGDFGITFVRDGPVCQVGLEHFEPSTNWAHGGPIIERERIALVSTAYGEVAKWDAAVDGFCDTEGGLSAWSAPGWLGRGEAEDAPTALIAAMRAFVSAKLGDEVELP